MLYHIILYYIIFYYIVFFIFYDINSYVMLSYYIIYCSILHYIIVYFVLLFFIFWWYFVFFYYYFSIYYHILIYYISRLWRVTCTINCQKSCNSNGRMQLQTSPPWRCIPGTMTLMINAATFELKDDLKIQPGPKSVSI